MLRLQVEGACPLQVISSEAAIPIEQPFDGQVDTTEGGLAALAGKSRTDEDLDPRVCGVEGSLRGLPGGACLYQDTRVVAGFSLPRQLEYAVPVTKSFANGTERSVSSSSSTRGNDP
jgi:hypothetical protein